MDDQNIEAPTAGFSDDPQVSRGREAANALLDAYSPFRAGWFDMRRWRFGGTIDLRAIGDESQRADAKRLLVSLYRRGQAEPNDWRSDGVARGQHYLLTQDGLQVVERIARAQSVGDVDFALPDRKRLPAPAQARHASDASQRSAELQLDEAWAPTREEDEALVRADDRRRRVARVLTRSRAMTDAALAAAPLADPRDGVSTQPIRPDFGSERHDADAADMDRRDAIEAVSRVDGRAAIRSFLDERPDLVDGLGLGARARAGARKSQADGAA